MTAGVAFGLGVLVGISLPVVAVILLIAFANVGPEYEAWRVSKDHKAALDKKLLDAV